MVTDSELKSIQTNTNLLGIPLSDEKEDTYSYLFYGLASTDETLGIISFFCFCSIFMAVYSPS